MAAPKTALDQRVAELEDLIIRLDCTFTDIETAKRKGYLARDLRLLRAEADRVHAKRKEL